MLGFLSLRHLHVRRLWLKIAAVIGSVAAVGAIAVLNLAAAHYRDMLTSVSQPELIDAVGATEIAVDPCTYDSEVIGTPESVGGTFAVDTVTVLIAGRLMPALGEPSSVATIVSVRLTVLTFVPDELNVTVRSASR